MTVITEKGPDQAWAYLKAARKHHPQAAIARHLKVDVRTVRRWEVRQNQPPPYLVHALQTLLPLQLPLSSPADFDFIDLFAGIGGIRAPFEEIGGRCVFTSEWDQYAQRTYTANYPAGHQIHGDITQIREKGIPDHDVLLAGFPCQPFSIAGVSKKNALGRAHGFQDETQGTLFFDVKRILKHKKPKAFLLENVKNLRSHDGGRTFDVILRSLTEDLGYSVHHQVVDGAHFVPQHRERILIAGFRTSVAFDWGIMNLPPKNSHSLRAILHKTDGSEPLIESDGDRYFEHDKKRVNSKYTLTDHLWAYLQAYAEKHRAKGNGFGFGLVKPDDIARTLSARYFKDGSEILIYQGSRKSPRRLTPRECARLMGFPDTFKIPVSDTRAYKQFGNAVVVPVIREVARVMRPFICEPHMQQPELPIIVAA
jgi:DNA (cytosine-5)-methyltransferase 1